MIAIEREEAILSLLKERGTASLRVLQQGCPGASAVTVRRDLAKLEAQGRLRRIHGGAVRIDAPEPAEKSAPEESLHAFDGLILPPVGGRWAHTLRQQAVRRGMPFLAESAPQAGGIYLGPANLAGSARFAQPHDLFRLFAMSEQAIFARMRVYSANTDAPAFDTGSFEHVVPPCDCAFDEPGFYTRDRVD